MKKVILTVLMILLIGILAFGIYIGYDVVNGMNNPQILLNEKAKSHISLFLKTPVPDDATQLFYSSNDFQDVFYNIGLTLPSKSAWQLIKVYGGVDKGELKKLKNKDSKGKNTRIIL